MVFARIFVVVQLIFAAGPVMAFGVGDEAYLCLEDPLNPNWPEKFAFRVKVLAPVERGRLMIEVLDSYPGPGRVNAENLPVKGDEARVSRKMLFTKQQAGVQPGTRFDGKPVCSKQMKQVY